MTSFIAVLLFHIARRHDSQPAGDTLERQARATESSGVITGEDSLPLGDILINRLLRFGYVKVN